MKLRTATRLFIVGITLLVILVALGVQLSRSTDHPTPGCAPGTANCVRITPSPSRT